MEALTTIPILAERFERITKNNLSHPFLSGLREEIDALLEKRIALSELPVMAQAAHHVSTFKYCWRGGLGVFDCSLFEQRFMVLRELAQRLGNADACSVFDSLIDRSRKNADSYMYNPAGEAAAKGHLELRGNHPDFEEARALFAQDNSFVDDAEAYFSEHVPVDFLSPEDWRTVICELVERVPDFWSRSHLKDHLRKRELELCEQLDARIIATQHSLFHWQLYKPARTGLMQDGKLLTSWTTGKQTACNDFDPLSVQASGLDTTKGYFWFVAYRDADELVDPETYRVLVSKPCEALRRETLLMRKDAPEWRLDPVRKRLTKLGVRERLKNRTQ